MTKKYTREIALVKRILKIGSVVEVKYSNDDTLINGVLESVVCKEYRGSFDYITIRDVDNKIHKFSKEDYRGSVRGDTYESNNIIILLTEYVPVMTIRVKPDISSGVTSVTTTDKYIDALVDNRIHLAETNEYFTLDKFDTLCNCTRNYSTTTRIMEGEITPGSVINEILTKMREINDVHINVAKVSLAENKKINKAIRESYIQINKEHLDHANKIAESLSALMIS